MDEILDKIGDFGRTKNDILDNIFLLSLIICNFYVQTFGIFCPFSTKIWLSALFYPLFLFNFAFLCFRHVYINKRLMLLCFYCSLTAFYPRDAMLARSLRQRRVCPSVCLSVTRQYCAYQSESRIVKCTPFDSPMTLVSGKV